MQTIQLTDAQVDLIGNALSSGAERMRQFADMPDIQGDVRKALKDGAAEYERLAFQLNAGQLAPSQAQATIPL
jgi:hypothetical protein